LKDDIYGIDVNMGCPMKFSTSGGMGAALMKNKENAISIMEALYTTYGKTMSISCKIRTLESV
jgi:tRNA-dihydrouridine synthase 2